MGAGHCSLVGMTADYDKLLAALLMGWKVVYLTNKHLSQERSEDVCHDIAKLLGIYTEQPKGYIPLHRRKV